MTLIISSTGLGVLADAIYTLCIAWYILEETNSAFLTSVIYTISFIVNVIFGPFIGVLVDRTSPKKAMFKAYLVLALIGLILIAAYLLINNLIIFIVLAMVILNDVAQAFINPSVGRMLPRLVGMKKIVVVNGYMSSVERSASVLGKAIAGILFSFIGFIGVMLTHSIIFLLASLLTTWLVLPKSLNKKNEKKVLTRKNYLAELKEGINTLKQQKTLLILSLMNMGVNVISVGHLYIVIFKTQYGANATQYGLLEASGIGVSILAGLFVGRLAKKIKPIITLSFSNIIAGLCMILIGFFDQLMIAVILLSIQMICSVFYGVVFGTLLITLVKEEFRARIDSLVVSISASIMPVTVLLGGYLADVIPVRYIFYVAGTWVILMSALPLLSKETRKIERIS
ncbi:MFS transporter [Ornithinibacillus scapharcae]|uniref:MFS transporter n=1 Tax=Ornithinibacillus scapharcae TaxID=1147159 RepID=UPI000225B0C7|nr:MFS transporter [Ornithinibacillus scapharcae]